VFYPCYMYDSLYQDNLINVFCLRSALNVLFYVSLFPYLRLTFLLPFPVILASKKKVM